MQNVDFKIILVYLIILFSACGTKQEPVPSKGFPTERKQQLDNFFQNTYESIPIPGLAVAIVQDSLIYSNATGKLSSDKQALITDSTFFFTGNISELMVATAIMKLAEANKISLEDPIVNHLPYFRLKGNYSDITIRHLLAQTGGIPVHSITWDLPVINDKALEATTKSVSDQQPVVSPAGSKVKRSPYNYDILADLIAKVSGYSFEDFAKKNIFVPLKMTSSTFYKPEIKENRLAHPHKIANWLTYSVVPEELYPYNREHAGSIGFHSTIKDISKWMFMLLHEGVTPDGLFLKKKWCLELMKPQYKTSKNSYVGFSWDIDVVNEDNVFRKSHQIGGFSANMSLIPQKHIGVIVLSNIASPDFNIHSISNQLLSWTQGNKLHTIKPPVSIAMGKILDSTGRLDDAFMLYNNLKKQSSSNYDLGVQALSQLGVNLLYRVEKPEQAIKAFEFAAQQFPGLYTQLNLTEAYLVNKQKSKAEAALKRTKELMPKNHLDSKDRIEYLDEILTKSETSIN